VDGKELVVEEEVDQPEHNENLNTVPYIISFPDSSNSETVTDNEIVTITKNRKIIRYTTVVDGKETVVEEMVDEPAIGDLTTLGPKNNERITEISIEPDVTYNVPVDENRTVTAHTTKTIRKVRKIIRRIKTVDGKETVEEEVVDEPENVTNLIEDKYKSKIKGTPTVKSVNVDVAMHTSNINMSMDDKAVDIKTPTKGIKKSDIKIPDLKIKKGTASKVSSLIPNKTKSIPKVKGIVSELKLPPIGVSDVEISSVDVKLPSVEEISAEIKNPKFDEVVDVKTPNVDIIDLLEVKIPFVKVENEKMPRESVTKDVIVEMHSVKTTPVSEPIFDKNIPSTSEVKDKIDINKYKSTAVNVLDEKVPITFTDETKSIAEIDTNYENETSQSINQNANSSSFLSKLRKGLKMSKTNKKLKDKNQVQVNETNKNIKLGVNEFLENEREHMNIYHLSTENQPLLSMKLDDNNKDDGRYNKLGKNTTVQTDLPDDAKSKNNFIDTGTVTVFKSRKIIRRILVIDGIEFEIEEIINEPETDKSIKKITKKIFKDGNEIVEEISDPNEIEKILQYSNGEEITLNESEIKMIKTRRIIRRIIVVDGKESIVEEEVDDPDITEMTEKQKPLKDGIEMIEFMDNPNDVLKLITFPETSNEITTDYNTTTITKHRKIIRRTIIVDGKETTVEEVVDEPTTCEQTLNKPLNSKEEKLEYIEKPKVDFEMLVGKHHTDTDHKKLTIRKVRKIIRRVKMENGKESVEEEIIDEPEDIENLRDFDVKKFGATNVNLDNVDVNISDVELKLPELTEVSNVKIPKTDITMSDLKISDLNIKKGKTSKISKKVDIDVTQGGLVKKPSVFVPSIDTNTFSITKMKSNVEKTKNDLPTISVPDVEVPNLDVKLPSVAIKLPSAEIKIPKVSTDVDINTLQTDINVPNVKVLDCHVKKGIAPTESTNIDFDIVVDDSVKIPLVSIPNIEIKNQAITKVEISKHELPLLSVPNIQMPLVDNEQTLVEVKIPSAEIKSPNVHEIDDNKTEKIEINVPNVKISGFKDKKGNAPNGSNNIDNVVVQEGSINTLPILIPKVKVKKQSIPNIKSNMEITKTELPSVSKDFKVPFVNNDLPSTQVNIPSAKLKKPNVREESDIKTSKVDINVSDVKIPELKIKKEKALKESKDIDVTQDNSIEITSVSIPSIDIKTQSALNIKGEIETINPQLQSDNDSGFKMSAIAELLPSDKENSVKIFSVSEPIIDTKTSVSNNVITSKKEIVKPELPVVNVFDKKVQIMSLNKITDRKEADFEKETSQLNKLNENTPSFLSKLRKGFKGSPSKTNKKSKDKININVSEIDEKIKFKNNNFLEKEREHTIMQHVHIENELLFPKLDHKNAKNDTSVDETLITLIK